MRSIVPLALAAGALATGLAAPASATGECYGAVAGGTSAYVCNERVWEKVRWYATCTIDAPGDKFDAVCSKIVLIEYYG